MEAVTRFNTKDTYYHFGREAKYLGTRGTGKDKQHVFQIIGGARLHIDFGKEDLIKTKSWKY